MDPTKCMICQGSLGLHPLKVKVDKRVGRICNRVDAEHAGWLLDRKMDTAYIKITHRRRGGIMGLMILMAAFLALLWIFAYSTEFKGPIMAAAGSLSIVIGLFLYVEFQTVTVGDRMRDMLREVELDRPIEPARTTPPLASLDDLDRLAPKRERVPEPFALDREPAPTSVGSRAPPPPAEDGIPGIPQPVVAPHEWEVLDVEGPVPPAPAPGGSTPPGIPPPPRPGAPVIEELPEEAVPQQAQPMVAPQPPTRVMPPPRAEPVVPQAPPAPPAQPLPPEPPRTETYQRPPPPTTPSWTPPPSPPAPQPPSQAPPTPSRAPQAPPSPPPQAPPPPQPQYPMPPPQPPKPQQRKAPPPEEEVVDEPWVEWE